MPRADYKNCKDCGRSEKACGVLSHTRLCGDCAGLRLLANLDALATREGPEYEHYLMRSLLATNAKLIATRRDRLPDDG